jgi:1-acyl-sn-glycerol-3-phosphate acyltransferase
MGHLYGFARRTHCGLTGQAALRSVLLSALFLGVYGGCNWIASQRADVGTWIFAWERHVPFWPAMIVPYLSIDAFFIAAPFVCRDGDELRVFTWRVTAAVLTAGACFLLMPLRFAFERPVAEGWLGMVFQQFTALDRPFNLVPSLHVTLAVLLADTYRRHTRGVLQFAVTAWFVLIGLSTVFTYQHHVVDVFGGLALAVMVFSCVRSELPNAMHAAFRLKAEATQSGKWLPTPQLSWFPALAGRRRASAKERNLRVAIYYVAGAAALVASALVLWPSGGLLLWPALSLAIVSAAYAGAGSWVFAKSKGQLPLTTWLMLWPCLIGQRASFAWYRRQCRPYDAVTPHVWIGRQLNDREAVQAAAAGVVAVVDLTPDFNETPIFTRLPYLNVPTLDLTAPDPASLERAVQFVAAHAQRGIVYVHCKIGYSRSAAVVAAFLLASGQARTVAEALAMIRHARPQVVIRPEIVACLNPRRRDEADGCSVLRLTASYVLAAAARLFCGAPTWAAKPDGRPRIYYANHTSHLDFVVIWGSLPRDVRMRTRPVAGRDYWDKTVLRRCIAHDFLNALLVDRARLDADRETTILLAERSVEQSARALDSGASLVVFPEGTRGSGDEVQPFKSGLYHLAQVRPDIEFVPVFLENIHRILPKGETIPVPLSGAVTFGAPLRLRPGETKAAFLARARHALVVVNSPCTPPSTVTSRPSLRAS